MPGRSVSPVSISPVIIPRMDKNRFSRFEDRIQRLVEGSFARLFAGRMQPREVALRLARAMEDNAQADSDGELAAPNHYLVHLHPDDHDVLLEAHPTLAMALADHLLKLAEDSGLRLDLPPDVELVPDQAVALHAVLVMAEHAETPRQATQAMPSMTMDEVRAATPKLPAAFLVIDGSRYVPLERSVINVGRRRDNAIVLDDPRVSRQHCQLRFRLGQFVLYDLGSRGGTFVNSTRITECALRPGDVISLAGVLMVYVLDDSSTGQQASRSGGDTQVRLSRQDLERDEDE